jgi:predicted secreted protein
MNSEAKELIVGTTLPVILPGLGTAGFQWFFKIENPACIEVRPRDYAVDTIRLDAGTSNEEIFMITAKAPGKSTITFEQRRIWEKEGHIINTKEFEITVI